MALRLVDASGEQQPPDEPKKEQPKDDPGLAALLDRLTVGRGSGRKHIYCPDEATLLRWGLRGKSFSSDDLRAIESWILEHDPYDRRAGSVQQALGKLDAFVRDELERVTNPAWLQRPLQQFESMVKKAQREQGASCNPRLLRAMFVAFLTVRAPERW